MTKRNTMLTVTLIVLLATGMPSSATAQEDLPGFEGPQSEGAWDKGPGWGRGGRGHGGPGMGGLGLMGPGGPGGPRAHGLRFALRKLDLSESQRQEIKTIFESEREQVRAYHESTRALGAELHDQIEADPYNESAVRAKAAAVAALGVEIAVLRARQAGRVRDVLTPEQLDQLEQMKEKRQEFREERRERFEHRRERRSNP